MSSSDLLMDAFERIRDAVHPAVNGLSSEELAFRLEAETNSIAWLVWHLTRIQDDHVAELAGREQVWIENGWVTRFGLPLDTADTGYGHGPDESAKVVAGSGGGENHGEQPDDRPGGRQIGPEIIRGARGFQVVRGWFARWHAGFWRGGERWSLICSSEWRRLDDRQRWNCPGFALGGDHRPDEA